MLELMHKHMDAKGKQAKLKSPAELQARPPLHITPHCVWRHLPGMRPALRVAAAVASPNCVKMVMRRSCWM